MYTDMSHNTPNPQDQSNRFVSRRQYNVALMALELAEGELEALRSENNKLKRRVQTYWKEVTRISKAPPVRVERKGS